MAYNIVATWLFSYGLSINILFKKFSMHSLNRRRYSLFHTRIWYDPFNTSWFPTSFDFQYYILLWHDIICRSRISCMPHCFKSCQRKYNIFKQQPTAHPVTQWLLEELTEKEHSKVQERFIINCLFGFVRVLFYFPIIVFMPRSM